MIIFNSNKKGFLTYKEAITRFQTRYEILSLANNARQLKLDDKKVLMLLSEIYADLANQYRLVEKISTSNSIPQTNLVANQYQYTAGTTATSLPNDIYDIYMITLNDTARTKLKKSGTDDMQDFTRSSRIPTQYSFRGFDSGMVLELDSLPQAYTTDTMNRLIIYYYQNINTYSGNADGSFADLDFSKVDYGGSFKTPTNWDNVIMQGALSNLFPNLYNSYQQMVKEAYASSPFTFDTELRSFAGVPIYSHSDNWEAGRDEPRP